VSSTKFLVALAAATLLLLAPPAVRATDGDPDACQYNEPDPGQILAVQSIPDQWQEFVDLWRSTGFSGTIDFGTARYRDLGKDLPYELCERYVLVYISCSAENDSCQVAIVYK
jgi:hypothetical protein